MTDTPTRPGSSVRAAGVGLVLAAVVTAWAAGPAGPPWVTLSVVATTDLHGYVDPRDGVGGLALFGGFVDNLRAARRGDGGGVILVDAGDAWLGGIVSNLSEGAVVVDGFNALGYTAAAIGNHDLEFGAVDDWRGGAGAALDPRGALQARARQARFPFLAANLVEQDTGRPVAWPNVRPSAIVDVAGVRVGLIGVMTIDALSLTLAPNVRGLATTPLAPAVEREARALRAGGATVVVVVAHAGGACADLTRPDDLSSCDDEAEIFTLARALPPGLVDAIAAGHTHDGVAHRVAGTPIVQAFSWGRAFGRVDLHVRRSDGVVARSTIHGPEPVCAWRDAASGACVNAGTAGAVAARYADRPVVPLAVVDTATRATRESVARLRATVVSPRHAAAVPRSGAGGESPLGNLMADAMRAMTPGADAALSYGAGPGGLRADLPPGAPTLGALYDVFPFDNRIEVLALTPAELARLIADHGRRPRWGARALGVSGLTVQLGCTGAGSVAVADAAGRPVAEARSLTVALSDFLAARARRLGVGRVAGAPAREAPLVRDALLTWFRREVPAPGLVGRWIAAAESPAACGP